nr:putative transcriptional regulatory protein c25b8.11 [Quercus suber]
MPPSRRSAHQHMSSLQPDGRPYRSHKFPACDACRRRKVRCAVKISKNSCQYCLERDLKCSRSWQNPRRGDAQSVSRPSILSNHETNSLSHPSVAKPSGASDRLKSRPPKESALLMVGPTMAEDIDVLERHLTGSSALTHSENPPYIQVSSSCGEPIVYHAVPREREGLISAEDPGVKQREIMEQILGPHKTDVIRLYVKCTTKFRTCLTTNEDRISATVMCEMYAISLLFWAQSDCLKQHHRPDMSYAWNQAVIALRDDFMAPSIATIHAALLDLLGRPMIQATGNIANIGRTVTLAHSFGLHRNPVHWSTTHVEKTFRSRLWSSLSHGTPPNICRQNYDVPLPTTDLESAVISTSHKRSLQSFAHLCALTQILGDILPLVYALLPNQQDFWRSIRRIECALDDWQSALPVELHAAKDEDDFATAANGASSLWFYFLSLRLMMHRLMFKVRVSISRCAALTDDTDDDSGPRHCAAGSEEL